MKSSRPIASFGTFTIVIGIDLVGSMFFEIILFDRCRVVGLQSGLLGDRDNDGDVDSQNFVFWQQGMPLNP